MSCPRCTCKTCRRDPVARLAVLLGQVEAAKTLGVSQSSISRHVNRKIELPVFIKLKAELACARALTDG